MRGYDTVEYAASRLVETIVRHKNIPVMVKAVTGTDKNITLQVNKLTEPEELIEIVNLTDCDLNPVSLGYCNYKRYATYIMRTPKRQDWKQGLRMLNIVSVEGEQPRGIPYPVIAQTIMNNYPTFKNTMNKLSEVGNKISSQSFHRDFAMYHDGTLEYKGLIQIGKVNMLNASVSLNNDSVWVGEALDKALEAA